MLRAVKNYITTIFRGGMDLLFPPLCFNCREKLENNEKIVCRQCWLNIPGIPNEILSQKDKGEYVDELFSRWLFDETFQHIIHLLKYKNCASLGKMMGRQMGTYLKEVKSIDSKHTILIPVPLHPVKLRERGYNQAQLITEGIAEETNFKVGSDKVMRIKNTATQTKMNRQERIANMQKAFQLKQSIDENIVIIVDDVFTTGTTINSVAQVIREQHPDMEIWAYSAAMPE